MRYALLPNRRLIAVTGDDTLTFLQGLVSCNVMPVESGKAAYGALLSPQGKFLHDFFLLPYDGGVLMDVAAGRADDLLQRLKMYKLRSKVAIEPKPALKTAAAWGGTFGGRDTLIVADPRLGALGYRIIGEAPEAWCNAQGMERAGDAAYERHRLELGVPDGAQDMTPDKSLLMEFGFEELHGVDFKKGCYVGQEVTARSKHRGQVRKFIHRVESKGTLPPAGTPVMNAGGEAGVMCSSSGDIGLALLRYDEVEKAGGTLAAGGAALAATLPAWAAVPPAGG